MEKWTGTIKFYNQKKKYGFIKYLYDDKEIFFHISDVYSGDREIYEGCVVSFLVSENQKTKKEKATNIKVIHVQDNYLREAMSVVEHNIERVRQVKYGEVLPDRCECCDHCRETEVLTGPIGIADLVADI